MSTHQIKLVTIIYAVLLGFCLLIPTGQAGGQESTTETSSGSAKPVAADEEPHPRKNRVSSSDDPE